MEKHIMGENGISYTLGEDGLYYPDLYLPEETEYVIESVLTRDKDNKVEFIAERSQVSRGIIEVLYLLRCSLMHGEVFPDNNACLLYTSPSPRDRG